MDAAAADEEASYFSLGSDAQRVEWHRSTALDMQWLGQLVVLLLRGLVRAERWHQSLALGKSSLCGVESVFKRFRKRQYYSMIARINDSRRNLAHIVAFCLWCW
jgi:hypothetical protein